MTLHTIEKKKLWITVNKRIISETDTNSNPKNVTCIYLFLYI